MKEVDKLIETLHPLERAVLPLLKEGIDFNEVVNESKLKDVEVMRALQWLENKEIVKLKKSSEEIIELDENGKKYVKEGLPEKKFLEALSIEGELGLNDVGEKAGLDKDELNVSLGILKGKAAIKFEKGKVSITPRGKELIIKELLEEVFLKKLPLAKEELNDEEKYAYNELNRRRGLVKSRIEKTVIVNLSKLGESLIKKKISGDYVDSLNTGILRSGEWKDKKFRRYDVEINVPRIYPAKRHFVNQAIEYIKKIWLDLGFKEMKGNLVESSFWNFDALFVPQDHPAREMQDTFFIKGKAKLPNSEIVKRVKAVHENGWTTGSSGWGGKWSEEEARRLVLRTHTTVLSARTIASLKKENIPGKFFSVGRIFRNEAIDWAHLFELHQIEGIIIDENVNFRNLLGYLKEYYNKLGIDKIRFRPSYYPYTEMSVDSVVYIPERRKWIELGGAGILRAEVVKPLLGIDVPVLAFGQGLERSIVDYYGIKDIREVYNNDLKELKERKIWLK